MLDINLTLPIVLVMFLVFAVLMNLVFFGPVVRILDARQELIAGRKRRAEEATARARELQHQVDAGLKSARLRATDALTEALRLAEGERQASLRQAGVEVANEVEAARQAIQEEKARLQGDLHREVSLLSDEIKRRALYASQALAPSLAGGHD